MSSWSAYYQRHAARPPSRLLQQALSYADAPAGRRVALDLGCGNGHEALLLQQRGWQVHAYDRESEAIERLRSLQPPPLPLAPSPHSAHGEGHGSLTAHHQAFEAMQSLPSASLIHAGLSLPFCAPEAFARFWSVVMAAWQPGGVFAGHFFGPRDAWAEDPAMSFHSLGHIQALLHGSELLHLDEFEGMAPSVGGPKYWHRIEVIARRAGR